MKRIIIVFILILLVVLSFIITTKKNKRSEITIGILQTASHPALDASREGFINKMKSSLGEKVSFVIKNAQGLTTNIHTIAQSFSNDNSIDGIMAIASPAGQAIANTEKKKPIFITAITDPQGLGLIHDKTNVCGSSDSINIERIIELIPKFVKDVKNVGIIFNTGEISSSRMANDMSKSLAKIKINPILVGITNENDIPAATVRICRSSDAVISPIDNTIASAISFVGKKCIESKIPLFVCDNLLIEKGAFVSSGVNYNTCGKQAAKCALEVFIKNKKPSNLPILKQKSNDIFVNKNILRKLNLEIPKELLDKVSLIDGAQ